MAKYVVRVTEQPSDEADVVYSWLKEIDAPNHAEALNEIKRMIRPPQKPWARLEVYSLETRLAGFERTLVETITALE